MKSHTLKALAVLALLAANLAHADEPPVPTPVYISPGIGTAIMTWLSMLR